MSRGPTEEPVPTVISLFRRGTRLMVDELVRRLDAAGYPGITASEHLIFESLPPAGARVTEIAARVGMTHQAAGELIAALETRRFLARRPDPADGRARIVVLTPQGRALIRTALREIAAIERAWSSRLADAGLVGDLRGALHAAVEQAHGERASETMASLGRRPAPESPGKSSETGSTRWPTAGP